MVVDFFFVSSHCLTVLGKSALHWAAAVNNVEATLVLLKNGANRDMQDNKVCSCVFTYATSNCSFVPKLFFWLIMNVQWYPSNTI